MTGDPSTTQPIPRGVGRALVVDDDAGVQRVMSRGLAMRGLQVDQAANGQDGLRRALTAPYAIVLLDLQMPKLDGMTVLRRLRAKRPDQAVIVVSGQSDLRTKAECLSAGAVGFLAKPFSLADLWASLSVASPSLRHLPIQAAPTGRPAPSGSPSA